MLDGLAAAAIHPAQPITHHDDSLWPPDPLSLGLRDSCHYSGFEVVVTVSARRAACLATIRLDGLMAPIEQGVAAFDRVVAVGPARLWSHDCSWDELAVLCDGLAEVRGELDLAADWPRRWTAACRHAGDEVACAVRHLRCLPAAVVVVAVIMSPRFRPCEQRRTLVL